MFSPLFMHTDAERKYATKVEYESEK